MFKDEYFRLSEKGVCDSPCGMEFERVQSEWLSWGIDMHMSARVFIRWRANIGPNETGFEQFIKFHL